MMRCPVNGLRNISEFFYAGEVKSMPHPDTGTDREWAEYIFIEDNINGIVKEWWMHTPSSTWFIAERCTSSDEVTNTYLPSSIFKNRVEYNSNN